MVKFYILSFAVLRYLNHFRFLRVYPGGNTEECRDSIALYLYLKEADSRSFSIKFILGIAGKNGSKEETAEYPGESFKTGYGAPRLMKRSDLLNPEQGCLVDGNVTFYCKVGH